MNELTERELEEVSGGLEVELNFGVIRVRVSGAEIMSAYDSAVNGMTDFFMWWDPQDLVQES